MARGFQVAIHAIGDRANTLALDALEHASISVPGNVGRHRIEHAQVLRPDDIPRFGRLGIIASMQPTHATSDMSWAEARLGPERLAGAYAWKSLLTHGAVLAFGSDFPVEDPNPLWGLYAARTRRDRAGNPEGGWRPSEQLTGEEALRGFTQGAAFASFTEARRGTLRPGMDADFVVIDRDPVEAPAEVLLVARIYLTEVAGREAFRAEGIAREGVVAERLALGIEERAYGMAR
jgi:predicted amidohydrolase YtcJ